LLLALFGYLRPLLQIASVLTSKMLTVTAAVDEGSSLGTPEGGSGNADADCISEGSLPNEAEWRLITSEGFDTQEGVLILDGEEAERTALDVLSLPGTDSVPTIVGSIDGLPNGSSNKASTKEEAEAAFEYHENRASAVSTTNLKMETHQGTQTVNTPSSGKSRLALFLFPTVALFLAPTMASVKLYGAVQRLESEKITLELSMQLTVDKLKYDKSCLGDHIDYLEEEKMLLSSHIAQLQEEVAELRMEVERKKQEEGLRWDECRLAEEDVVLVDNCWLSATANVRLGNCANDAKEVVKNFSFSLLSTWMDPFAHYEDDESGSISEDESVASVMNKVDSLGKALWNATTVSAKQAYEKGIKSELEMFPSFFYKMEANGKSWLKESIFNMFVSQEDEDTQQKKRPSSSRTKHHSASNLDDVVSGISDMLRAAGKSMAAGEAFMAAAIEKAMNETSMNDWVDIAARAFEDASLNRPAEK
jgi:hypothetical protein